MESNTTLVNVTRQENNRTYNDMLTNSTSLNSNVDMFFLAGATRQWSEKDIETLFQKAIVENPTLALKTLFWVRDIRGGAGERRFFRVCSKFLNKNYVDYLEPNIKHIPEYGRWDDVFDIENDEILPLIKKGLEDGDGLLAKWLPRKNDFSNKIRKYLRLSPKEYRKLIVGLSNTVEQSMCSNNWDSIEYQKVPSVAMNKYRRAFERNDESRFGQFIDDVADGKAEIKASAIFPHMLYEASKRGETKKAVEAQWNALPDYMTGDERVLPVCDVSGSMTGQPMSVSVSLGIYLSERNKGIFKDAFVTFSNTPTMQYLKGSLYERIKQLERSQWDMNTNLESVFNLLLSKSVKHNIPKNEMPTKILIISDMEFDSCVRNGDDTAISMIDKQYEESGYVRPEIIFWNVNGRLGNVPGSHKHKGLGLVSGFSPAIMKNILEGKVETPTTLMLKSIMSERYDPIKI